MTPTIATVLAVLPADRADILTTAHTRWTTPTGWALINTADPCGT